MKPTTFQCSVWYCASSGRVAAVWPGKEPLQVPLGDQPAGLQTNTSGVAEQTQPDVWECTIQTKRTHAFNGTHTHNYTPTSTHIH